MCTQVDFVGLNIQLQRFSRTTPVFVACSQKIGCRSKRAMADDNNNQANASRACSLNTPASRVRCCSWDDTGRSHRAKISNRGLTLPCGISCGVMISVSRHPLSILCFAAPSRYCFRFHACKTFDPTIRASSPLSYLLRFHDCKTFDAMIGVSSPPLSILLRFHAGKTLDVTRALYMVLLIV